jgi:hypothetical protein
MSDLVVPQKLLMCRVVRGTRNVVHEIGTMLQQESPVVKIFSLVLACPCFVSFGMGELTLDKICARGCSFGIVYAVARDPCADNPMPCLRLNPMRSSARFRVVADMRVLGMK